ncbi:MAG: nickel pincer cofactor biosynthesis protein LarB [Planctomycetaceae bacterium]|nr:nickel pincer cofactor biosynthesis protein LarB [Planctomycetaceae bacterium]
MDPARLENLAQQLLDGQLEVAEFVLQLSRGVIADLGVAQVDLDRNRRCGFPEVVYGAGKPPEALVKIFAALLEAEGNALATRVAPEQAELLLGHYPQGHYNALGRTFRIGHTGTEWESGGTIAILTAGTSDLPVAEEAKETALWMGAEVRMIYDVGVAGPHRLPARLAELADVDAVVVIAGMEGALPSVVGGYVPCPVIGVPTSVGYGANLGGVSALLSMLNSCAANVSVVNIDAGFKGAYVAGLIAKNAARNRSR